MIRFLEWVVKKQTPIFFDMDNTLVYNEPASIAGKNTIQVGSQLYNTFMRPYADVLVKECAKHGPCFILTNNASQVAKAVMDFHKLSRYLSGIYGMDNMQSAPKSPHSILIDDSTYVGNKLAAIGLKDEEEDHPQHIKVTRWLGEKNDHELLVALQQVKQLLLAQNASAA